jgi:hypothetical protein
MTSFTQASSNIETDFVERVLRPYRDHCRYLKAASYELDIQYVDGQSWRGLITHGEFSIDQSCYIDDTGHFNAVEFNICYNQLAYVHLAMCVREGWMAALSDFTLATFYEKQLSNYLIHNIHSHYHTQINPRRFFGEVRVLEAKKRGKLSILQTHCRFYDESNGTSDGEVKLAVISP